MPAINLVKHGGLLPVIAVYIRQRQETHYFMVDTGAQASVLARDFTNHTPIATANLCGAGGVQLTPIVAFQFNLFGKQLNRFAIDRSLGSLSQGLGIKLSGIIGQDLLQQFSSYTIDNKKGRFIFNL